MSSGAGGRRLRAAGRRVSVALALAGLFIAGPQPVESRPTTVTKVKHYLVSGNTAQSLDQEMNARGPWHGRGRAYANVVIKPDYTGELVQGRSCTLKNFKVTAEFTMTLPKLVPGTKLSGDLRSRWASFETFVRRHEEGHRTIWLASMGKAERRIVALRARTCPELQTKIDSVFDEEWRISERQQDAYDRAEQKKLARHPLILAATRVDRGKAQAIRASQRQSQSRAVRSGKAAN